MKKIIKLVLSLTILVGIITGSKMAFASNTSTENNLKTIAIATTHKEFIYPTYRISDNKMVKKGKISPFGAERLNHWHAKKVVINNSNWWKIGKNTYIKAYKNIVTINTKKMNELGSKVTNYKN